MYWNKASPLDDVVAVKRLTLTWDVLKCGYRNCSGSAYNWLTLTWDVLKFKKACRQADREKRLTLTWDVLKLFNLFWPYSITLININMRCIEMNEGIPCLVKDSD